MVDDTRPIMKAAVQPPHILQIGIAKHRFEELGLAEVRPAEVRIREVRLAEFRR